MTTVVAPIFGPILGGYISDNYHWGWIFHINVLFGAAVASVVWWHLRTRETPIERKRIDVVGLLLPTVFVCAFQVMVDTGRELDWFPSSFLVWGELVTAGRQLALISWDLLG